VDLPRQHRDTPAPIVSEIEQQPEHSLPLDTMRAALPLVAQIVLVALLARQEPQDPLEEVQIDV
jgi:hypothetical protein